MNFLKNTQIIYLLSLIIFACQTHNYSDFEKTVFLLVYPEDAGEIIFDFDNPVSIGDTITLTARSIGRYQFSHWLINDSINHGNEIVIVIDSDIQIIAYFKNAPLIYGISTNLVLDLTDPVNPIEYNVDFPHDLAFTTNFHRYVYAAEPFPNRMYCYDFGDITNPTIIDSVELSIFPGNYNPINYYPYLAVFNKYALEIINISSPFSALTYGPVSPIYEEQYSLTIENDIMYQAGLNKLITRDFSDPNYPTYNEYNYDWLNGGYIQKSDNILYSTGKDTIFIHDASDLSNLNELANIPLRNEYYNWNYFVVKDGILFQYDNDLIIIHDLTELTNIFTISNIVLPQECDYVENILFYFDNLVVVGLHAIYIYNIEDITNPIFLNSIGSDESMEHFQLFNERSSG